MENLASLGIFFAGFGFFMVSWGFFYFVSVYAKKK